MKSFYKLLTVNSLSFLCFFIICFLAVDLPAAALKVDVNAKAGVLMNEETGEVLWEKNGHQPLPPASTTKVATALFAMEKKRDCLNERAIASREALAIVPKQVRRDPQGQHPPHRLEFGGTHMALQVGEEMTIRSLLEGLLLVSGNDAANVIAEHISGSIPLFMEEMNRFAREKGCYNTSLLAPHGLTHPDHKISAYDMAVLARHFLQHPALKEIACSRSAVRPQTNKQQESILLQHNPLIKPGKFYYPKAKGIKTGYTDAAGYCIVSAAEDEHRKLIVVLFGCDTREDRYQDAVRLFEAAFKEKKVERKLLTRGFDQWTHPCEGGKTALQAALSEDVVMSYYPSEEPKLHTRLIWDPVTAPVYVGQRVGRVEVLSAAGVVLASAAIESVRDVEKTWGHTVRGYWHRFSHPLKGQSAWMMACFGGLILGGSAYLVFRKR